MAMAIRGLLEEAVLSRKPIIRAHEWVISFLRLSV